MVKKEIQFDARIFASPVAKITRIKEKPALVFFLDEEGGGWVVG